MRSSLGVCAATRLSSSPPMIRPRRADPRRGRVRPRAHTFSRLAVIATTKASTARAPSPAIRPLLLLDAQGAQQDRHPPAQRTAGRPLPALARERPQATPAHAELEALALQAATDAGGWGRNSGAEV